MRKTYFSDSKRDLSAVLAERYLSAPVHSDSVRDLFRKILTSLGGAPVHSDNTRDLLRKILTSLGGVPVYSDSVRDLLRKIVVAVGGTPLHSDSVRDLLAKWVNVEPAEPPPPSGPVEIGITVSNPVTAVATAPTTYNVSIDYSGTFPSPVPDGAALWVEFVRNDETIALVMLAETAPAAPIEFSAEIIDSLVPDAVASLFYAAADYTPGGELLSTRTNAVPVAVTPWEDGPLPLRAAPAVETWQGTWTGSGIEFEFANAETPLPGESWFCRYTSQDLGGTYVLSVQTSTPPDESGMYYVEFGPFPEVTFIDGDTAVFFLGTDANTPTTEDTSPPINVYS